MPHLNITKNRAEAPIENSLLLIKADVAKIKIARQTTLCKHRDPNNWCNKSRQPCALLSSIFFNL